MEAKYGNRSADRKGHGERHDKHAGQPYRKHAKIRKAPFRMR